MGSFFGPQDTYPWAWNVSTLQREPMVQPTGGGGTGGAGDASAANQVIGNASLASIDGKLPALSGGRIPVVLPAGGSGLTDTELRATPVPVTVGNFPATQPVSGTVTATGPLTDTQLRASAVPVSVASVPSHPVTNAGTFAVQVTSAPTTAVTGTFFQPTQPVSAVSLPLPTGAATEATLDARTGSLTEAAPASDTASSGLNGRLQRIAQRVTSLIAQLPATLGQKTMAASLSVVVSSDQTAIPTTKQPTGGTNVLKTGTITTSATTVDQVVLTYTVTAAKTFYLCYLVMYGRLTVPAATATILGAISMETPSGTKTITLDDMNPTTSELEFNPLTWTEPIPIAAGVVIRVVVTPAAATSMLWRASFGGFEK
jgi:hypothetical protein